MVDSEIFDPGEPVLLDCIRFCFERNLQALQMNGFAICFRKTKTTHHLVGLTLCTSPPPHLYGTAETDEFIDINGDVPSNFSHEFGEFAETLMNENKMNIPHDASSAFELYLYLLSKIEEYS